MPLALIFAAAVPLGSVADLPEDQAIIVTGSRQPAPVADTPVSATLFDRPLLQSLSLPMAEDLLRLSPGVAITQSGPRGTQVQLRIRGAEANHTLLFVDGIRFNDPAAGNEARFELLTSDDLARIEVVRGPQSALWGSEALGGVVAVDSANEAEKAALLVEGGSLGSVRASGSFSAHAGALTLSGTSGWLRSDGIDSFVHGGERDGFDTRHASLKAVVKPVPFVELGLVGHIIEGRSDYDGLDPVTFVRADTLDVTRNRIGAIRAWGRAETKGWTFSADASWLGSLNRNRLNGSPLNRTSGKRASAGAQASKRIGGQLLTAAIEHEAEDFHARDPTYGGARDQDRSRHLTALVGEWKADWAPSLSTDLALRHDSFSAFADATSFRAAAIVKPFGGWHIHAAYGEGIAQPTFYDLYGFFPGAFRGNPGLKPERSGGWEAGIGWRGGKLEIGATGFSSRLEDEIVDTFDPATFLSGTANATGASRRRGIELDATYRPSPAFSLSANYSWLDADEQKVAGTASVKEVRRPRDTFNLIAMGMIGRFGWSATAAYIGKRTDKDFDLYPAPVVHLDAYILAAIRVAWKLTDALEAYARAENALDEKYQDVVGYRMPGRTVYAGIRLRLGS